MADDRTYVKLHDGFDEHPKVAGLSDKEFRTYIETLCYSARNLTDGRISFAVARKIAPPRVWANLTEVGLIEVHGRDYLVHDYLEHQRSAEQVKQLKQARREAGKRGGEAKAKGLASARGVASDLLKQTPSKSVPDTEAEGKRTELLSDESDEPDLFADFYDAYPRKEAKRKAEQAWRAAIKRGADPADILIGLQRFEFSTERRFIPLPASWLNADRWSDQAPALAAVPDGRLSNSELENLLGPDVWSPPDAPSGMDPDEAWEWQRQRRIEHIAERQSAARARMGRTA